MMAMEGLGGGSLKIKLKLKPANGAFSSENEVDSSIRFVDDVRKRFTADPQIYKEFLDAIVDYSRGNFEETDEICVKIVALFFGHADLIHQFKLFFNERDEELRRKVERGVGFAIDDRMCEIEVLWGNLRSSLECAEDALRLPPSELLDFVKNRFVGIKLMGIKRLYGEWSEEMIECLRKDPEKALPVLLVRLRDKERLVSMLRSAALRFLRQFHALNSNRCLKRKFEPGLD